MWKKNFLFRAHEAAPLKESENELFHDAEPALDSAGLQMEKFLSVWVQGEGEDDSPSMYTNIYVRTAALDFRTRAGFLQPLRYVEDLNDARTPLAEVFSILLEPITLYRTRFENGRPIPPRLAETLWTTTRAKSPSAPASTSA